VHKNCTFGEIPAGSLWNIVFTNFWNAHTENWLHKNAANVGGDTKIIHTAHSGHSLAVLGHSQSDTYIVLRGGQNR